MGTWRNRGASGSSCGGLEGTLPYVVLRRPLNLGCPGRLVCSAESTRSAVICSPMDLISRVTDAVEHGERSQEDDNLTLVMFPREAVRPVVIVANQCGQHGSAR